MRDGEALGAKDLSISFVVPAYNEERLLPATLTAILAELLRESCAAEIIASIARSFKGVRVVEEPVKSLARARQAGFTAANGRLIANIDADTVLPEGWLERVLAEFDANPRLVALSGPYVYSGISRPGALAVRGFYVIGYGFYVLNRFVFRVGSMLQGGNFVVSREALARIGGYSSDFAFYGEDTDVACRLAAVGEVKFTFRQWAHSSGRRLAKEGIVRMGARYALNFIWTTFFRRPFTRTFRDIR
jgi:cellulose synthase/poly-beta-1,6-N-acetylglucosamine synthase-like glycosyltransferase